jgi:hypothetical protein
MGRRRIGNAEAIFVRVFTVRTGISTAGRPVKVLIAAPLSKCRSKSLNLLSKVFREQPLAPAVNKR